MPSQIPEALIEYLDPPGAGVFVDRVMLQVKRQKQIRKLILIVTGLTGALFGVTGAVLLSPNIGQLVTTSMSSNGPMPVSLALIATTGFLAWLFSDEPGLIL